MRKTTSDGVDWPDLFGEPEVWRELQERARNERDPRKLETIIAEMNQLLAEYEKRAGNGNSPHSTSRRGPVKTTPSTR